eukprot:Nitzschia sp. Nitz4//scaffold128_size63911//62114//63913//NITZ4_006235-RA/size63911-augustus-gene-0.98-mRNA-1//1//CDS//3329534880//8366//frame0
MASLVTCVATATTWCFCTAAASLLSSCCGNDKPSSVEPGEASGRKRSVLLLILAIVLSLGLQYVVAPHIINFDAIGNFVTDAWLEGCDDLETDALIEQCAGNAGVYRSAFSAVVVFLLSAIAVCCKRTANREAWPAKYVLFVFLVAGLCFVPNDPLFLTVFLNIARVGAILFIVVAQFVIVDLAYNWNDSWVEKSNATEQEEAGSGKKWLHAILVSVAFLFIVSIVGWVLLFANFGGCSSNTLFITVTIALSLIATMAQMSGDEASLLTSACITAYGTMLCYSAVSKNDDATCNPKLGEEDVVGTLIGIGLTLVVLGYAGWSATAAEKLGRGSPSDDAEDEEAATEKKEEEAEPSSEKLESPSDDAEDEEAAPETQEKAVGGVVTNDYGATEDKDEEEPSSPKSSSAANSWKLNVVLACVSCWYAMALTKWGAIVAEGTVADPLVGRTNMWIIISTQWFAMTLYIWTLVAPRVFPD